MSDRIDLNADVGEECGDDAALLDVVTSANVAAGGHAGGGAVLVATVRLAASASVTIGAHPSYPDRAGFGRVSQRHLHDRASIARFVHEQVVQVAAACSIESTHVSHVKGHGALYHDACQDEALAQAFLEGVGRASHDLGHALAVTGLPGSALERVADVHGVPFVAEAFADRAYARDGSLVPRSAPGAVLTDHAAAVRQVRQLVHDGTVTTIDGTTIALRASTVCVHGDTPSAVELARELRADLEDAGVTVAPVRWWA